MGWPHDRGRGRVTGHRLVAGEVSRDRAGYAAGPLPAFSPAELLALLH